MTGAIASLPARAVRAVEEIPAYLAAFTNYESVAPLAEERRRIGPERARRLMARVGLLPPSVPVVQVAGSKGKGSTVLWMESLLIGRAERPGAYVSPHLERIHERIRLGGRESSDAELVAGLARLHPFLERTRDQDPEHFPSFFDLWTALALLLFAERECRVILLEVGLGGPLDSTSAVPHDVGVLTSIDLEHRAELGDTIEAIACEKARIARRSRPFLVAEPEEPWFGAVRAVAEERGAIIRGPVPAERIGNLVAPPQDRNLRAAIAALEQLPGVAPFDPSEIAAAAARIELPARLEVLAGRPPVLVDGAHTPRSFAWFARRFRDLAPGGGGVVLTSFLEGKEWEAALAAATAVLPGTAWLVTRAHPLRAVEPARIAACLRGRGAAVEVVEDPERAIAALRARGVAGSPIGTSGSFYLAGLVRRAWRDAG